MRILFLAHRLPYPPNKGDRIRSFAELRALSRLHEVDLFCFYDQAGDRQHITELRQYCRRFYAEHLSWPQSRGRSLAAVLRGKPFSAAYFYSPRMARALNSAVRSTRYDAVFLFSSSMAAYRRIFDGVPLIMDMVDVDSDKWAQYAGRSSPPLCWLWSQEARLLGRWEAEVAAQSSVTMLCTDAEAAVLRRRVHAEIRVVGNPLDRNFFSPDGVAIPEKIASWQPYVIFTGAMDYRANVDAAIHFCREIFPGLKKQVPGLKFVIAGMNPHAAVRKLANDVAVRVTGAVPDIRPYLKAAAAAVVPLRIARGIQNKVLEALAMGLPVVTTAKVAASLPENIAHFLLVGDTPAEFASAVIDAVGSAVPRADLNEVCSSLSERYSFANFEAQLAEVLATAGVTRLARNLQQATVAAHTAYTAQGGQP